MSPYHHLFDVVNCRGVTHGIPDFKSFLVEAATCMKPGGVLFIIGTDGPEALNEQKVPITEMTPGKEGFSHFNRFLDVAVKASAVSIDLSPR